MVLLSAETTPQSQHLQRAQCTTQANSSDRAAMAPLSPLQHMHPINGRSPDGTPKKPGMEPNVVNVVLGDLLIKPWYPSFYPEELVGRKTERLYVCQWCFKYSKELMPFLGHVVRLSPTPTQTRPLTLTLWR